MSLQDSIWELQPHEIQWYTKGTSFLFKYPALELFFWSTSSLELLKLNIMVKLFNFPNFPSISLKTFQSFSETAVHRGLFSCSWFRGRERTLLGKNPKLGQLICSLSWRQIHRPITWSVAKVLQQNRTHLCQRSSDHQRVWWP